MEAMKKKKEEQDRQRKEREMAAAATHICQHTAGGKANKDALVAQFSLLRELQLVLVPVAPSTLYGYP